MQRKKGFMNFHKPLNKLWYARLGSNQRLSAPEADALSTELRARIDVFNEKQYIVSGGKSSLTASEKVKFIISGDPFFREFL